MRSTQACARAAITCASKTFNEAIAQMLFCSILWIKVSHANYARLCESRYHLRIRDLQRSDRPDAIGSVLSIEVSHTVYACLRELLSHAPSRYTQMIWDGKRVGGWKAFARAKNREGVRARGGRIYIPKRTQMVLN